MSLTLKDAKSNKYRKTNAKLWCEHCKYFIQNNEICIKRHEKNEAHKSRVESFVKEKESEERELQKLRNAIQGYDSHGFDSGNGLDSSETKATYYSRINNKHLKGKSVKLTAKSGGDLPRLGDEGKGKGGKSTLSKNGNVKDNGMIERDEQNLSDYSLTDAPSLKLDEQIKKSSTIANNEFKYKKNLSLF